MTKSQYYILHELNLMKKECREKDISASEWVKRYGEGYCRRNSNGMRFKIRNG